MEVEKSYVLNVNENAAHYLYKSAQWSKFFAILGFIFAGIMVLLTIFMIGFGTFLPIFSKSMPMEGSGVGPAAMFSGVAMVFIAIIYLGLSLLYFIVSLKLYRFADKAKIALNSNSDEMLELSFKNLNSALTIMGIVTIIVLAIYVIMFIVMALAGFGTALLAR